MSKHNHKKECAHKELEYCKECDVVECVKCDKEFGDKQETTPYIPGIPVYPFAWTGWHCNLCGQTYGNDRVHNCINPFSFSTSADSTITLDSNSQTGIGNLLE